MWGRLSLIAAACLVAMNASGQTAEGASDRRSNVGFTLGTGYSDNLFQAGGGSTSGTYKSVGLIADIDRESRRFRGVVQSDLEYRYYSNSSIEDEPWGNFDAELELRAVPERFSWFVVDNFAEGTTDPFLPTGPGNREPINVFETGPAVYLPLGAQTEFRIVGLAGQRSFDDSAELDSDTTTTTAGVFREINATTEVGFEVSSHENEYDIMPIANNTIDAAYFSYVKQLASGTANLIAGVNEVDFSTRSDDAPYLDISWSRDVGRRSSLSLAFVNRLIDAGEQFRGRGDDSRDTVLSLDVFEERGLDAILNVDGGRADISFGVSFNKDRYQSANDFDNDTFGISFGYNRDLTPLMAFNEFSDTRAIIGIERLFSRKLALSAQYERTDRSNASAFTFDENQITIQVRWDLNPDATPDPF
jgi:hypothetical protein